MAKMDLVSVDERDTYHNKLLRETTLMHGLKKLYDKTQKH